MTHVQKETEQMTTNEIITELLAYDGFTKDVGTHSIKYISEIDNEGYRTVIGNEYAQAYLTDLNILHRVAVKVYSKMQSKITDSDKGIDWDASSHCNTILYALLDSPINGEYITLATATAEAIIYLKKYKS
jgi:hypothetical protein